MVQNSPHVTVEESHHRNADVRAAHKLGDLAEIIVAVCGNHKFPWLFSLLVIRIDSVNGWECFQSAGCAYHRVGWLD